MQFTLRTKVTYFAVAAIAAAATFSAVASAGTGTGTSGPDRSGTSYTVVADGAGDPGATTSPTQGTDEEQWG